MDVSDDFFWEKQTPPRGWPKGCGIFMSRDKLWLRLDGKIVEAPEEWEPCHIGGVMGESPASIEAFGFGVSLSRGMVIFHDLRDLGDDDPPFPPLNPEIVRRNVQRAREEAREVSLRWHREVGAPVEAMKLRFIK